MLETRKNIMKQLGFKEIEVVYSKTKRSDEIKGRVSRCEYYIVYSNGELVTVQSPVIVTKPEAAEYSKMTGLKYKKIGTIVDDAGMWSEWVKAAK